MTEDESHAPIERETSQRGAPAATPHPVLRTGVCTGLALVIVLLAALAAANRFPVLERYALERDAVSYGVFFILMMIPLLRFLRSPLQMFASALIAWVVFAIGYSVAGLFFQHLFAAFHRTPFEVFMEGAVVYGVCAVCSWVAEMVIHACRHSIAPDRPAARDVTRGVR